MQDLILEMKHITKDFSGNKALDDVTFEVKRGERFRDRVTSMILYSISRR